jgi:hypothetical protein
MGDGSGGRSPCSECISGQQCSSAACNLECERLGPNQCQTWVMGGGKAGPYEKGSEDYAEFLCQRVMRCNEAMTRALFAVGDTVTHVDDRFLVTQAEFAEAVRDLRGKKLRVVDSRGSAYTTILNR